MHDFPQLCPREKEGAKTARQLMKETGLSHKHSGDHPMLKAFSDHLEKTQKHKYFQQDVSVQF